VLTFNNVTANNETLIDVCVKLERRIIEKTNNIRTVILRDRPQIELHELNGKTIDIAERELQSERINEVGIEFAAQEWQQYLAWKHRVVTKDLLLAQLASQGEELNRARIDREYRDKEMTRMQELLRIESVKNQKLERDKVRNAYSDIPTTAGDPMSEGQHMHSDAASSVGYSLPGYRGFGDSFIQNSLMLKQNVPVYNVFLTNQEQNLQGINASGILRGGHDIPMYEHAHKQHLQHGGSQCSGPHDGRGYQHDVSPSSYGPGGAHNGDQLPRASTEY